MKQLKKYEVFHPDHETLVQSALDMKNAINSENFARLFEKAGFLDKQPDEWVPLQLALDIFNELESRGGAMMDFVSIGMKVGLDIAFPPEFIALSFEDKLAALAATHAMYHRGSDIGYAKTERLSAQHLVYRTRIPYPDNLIYGIIYAVSKRFLPSSIAFKLYYDEAKPRREQGGYETLIHIEWWNKE